MSLEASTSTASPSAPTISAIVRPLRARMSPFDPMTCDMSPQASVLGWKRLVSSCRCKNQRQDPDPFVTSPLVISMRYDREAATRDEQEEPAIESEPLLASHVEGSIYFVRDRAWGFVAPGREDHPGLCLYYDPESRWGTFLKGTDVGARHRAIIEIAPTTLNGLSKPTAFELVVRRIPRRLVELMHNSRRLIGRVEPQELEWIRGEMIRLFGRGGAPTWLH